MEPPFIRPASPVVGCLLTRLEVQDISTNHVYEANPPQNQLSLTLDADDGSHATSRNLLLLLFVGRQQLLRVNLTEILNSAYGTWDLVSVTRHSQQLGLKIPTAGRTLLVTFRERRDFGMTTRILEKAGFTVQDIAIDSNAASSHARAESPASAAPALGPRLSAITPLPGFYSYPERSENTANSSVPSVFSSQASIKRSDVALSHLAEPLVQNYSPQSHLGDSLLQPISPSPTLSYLNPYTHFLGSQANKIHKPQVSSPLRNSLDPVAQNPQSSVTEAQCDTNKTSHDHTVLSSESFTRWSAPQHSKKISVKAATVSISADSNDLQPIVAGVNKDKSHSQVSPHNFRELLPQPRKLPFLSKNGKRAHSVSNDSRRSSRSTAHSHKCSTDQLYGRVHPQQAAVIVIADLSILQLQAEDTSGFLEQYEADVRRGCDKTMCAQYYMAQIIAARRAFWYARLLNTKQEEWGIIA
ncbi:hypothetical protein S40288_07814 [Stachybotrys chartarum IBT 40288]|nr:hypothetical protein S40288_07814 [Stachybotrys chartarum IBT 40288]